MYTSVVFGTICLREVCIADLITSKNTSSVIRGLGNFTPIPVVGYVGTCSQNWETLHFPNLGDLEAEVPKPGESDLGNLWDFTLTCSRM